MSDNRKKRAADIQESIRQILYREWDPIGVCDLAPEDEYDSYIGPVYQILAGSRSEEELIEYLFHTERDTIGLPCESPEQLRTVARRFLEIDVNLD